jgi:hypothetical protein
MGSDDRHGNGLAGLRTSGGHIREPGVRSSYHAGVG